MARPPGRLRERSTSDGTVGRRSPILPGNLALRAKCQPQRLKAGPPSLTQTWLHVLLYRSDRRHEQSMP